jgi:DMSO/TMAO reductase YedYZ molybdopterin-dependent catalytic subunit
MKVPWVNILLLILLVIQTVTGYLGLVNGRSAGAWTLWLHGIIAYALVVALFAKSAVIRDAWRRKKRWTARRVAFVVTLLLLLLVLAFGLLWTFAGPIYVGGFSLVSLHIYLAVPLMALMLYHAWHMRFIRRVAGATGRRLFLAGLVAAGAGALAWAIAGRLKPWFGLPGAARRFTGSYEIGSFTANFPVVSWIADRPPFVDPQTWRLRVEGAVDRPQILTLGDLATLPPRSVTTEIDCTGGWYSVQSWQGVSVAELLQASGVRPEAASVTFESITGYKRRFDLTEAQGFLLAMGIEVDRPEDGGTTIQPLSAGHGYPARLVAPGRRGVEWVKWLAVIRLNQTGPHFQSPLPLQ